MPSKFRSGFTLCFSLFLAPAAFADAGGKPVHEPVSCTASVFSAADVVCKLFTEFAGAELCAVTKNECAVDSQELFTGTNLNLTGPVRAWTGFGGGGAAYSAAQLCLLRDLKDGPLTAEAKAATALGNVRTRQTVQMESFDRTKLEWVGWQRAEACAPVIGCMDIITQKIRANAVATPYSGAGSPMAGEFAITSSHAVDVHVDGVNQALKTTIPAIEVVTPYGTITPKPEFSMGRGTGLKQAPWAAGNRKSLLTGPWSSAKMVDLYGRNPGTLMSQVYPTFTVFGSGTVDNRVIGYFSQAGAGSRDANPKSAPWSPASGVEFPTRPDLDLKVARSADEKSPNANLGANVRLEYSPVDLLPEAIRNNPYITIAFDVWAKPIVEAFFSSQFNLQHYEIADGRILLTPTGPVDYRNNKMNEWKGVNLAGVASAAARFALEAGVDLTIHLHVPLLVTDIDLDLINIHPVAVPIDSTVSDNQPSTKTAYAFTQAKASAASGEFYQQYHKFTGAVPSGTQEVKACLAAPNVTLPPPAPPKYTPGNPNDLTKLVEYPCNICVGMNDYHYTDDNGVVQTIPGFLQWMFPASQAAMPTAARWTCDKVYESGCYDMCTYNPKTKELKVVKTALQLIAAGQVTGMPGRCR